MNLKTEIKIIDCVYTTTNTENINSSVMYNAKLEILTFDIACKQISLDELQKIVVSITEMFEQPGNELAVVNNGPIMNLVFNTKNKLKGSSTEEINEAMDWATKTAKKLLGIK